MEKAMNMIKEEMDKKDREIECWKQQLQEKDVQINNMKRELEKKTGMIEKKKAKIMNFTQYVLDFNEELQNEKKDDEPFANKDEKAVTDQETKTDEPTFWKDFLEIESSGSDTQQTAKPSNEYGGFVKYDNRRRRSLPRAARMRAKSTRGSTSGSESDQA
ncbi:unnamed protein product [Oikopleura dioica]|uniref:Uncharacterized protein n=1 Tax=Oikopleura dioica TaxID=34765 RepID=E4YJC3_OIKDI|nr:unnamed protein product [Oikopleura dioica]